MQAEHVSRRGDGGGSVRRRGQLEVVEQLVPLRRETGGAGNHEDRREGVGTAPTPRGFQGFQASELDERGLRSRGEELAARLGGDRADELQIRAQQPEAQHSRLELSEASRAVERGDGRVGRDHPVDLSSGGTIGSDVDVGISCGNKRGEKRWKSDRANCQFSNSIVFFFLGIEIFSRKKSIDRFFFFVSFFHPRYVIKFDRFNRQLIEEVRSIKGRLLTRVSNMILPSLSVHDVPKRTVRTNEIPNRCIYTLFITHVTRARKSARQCNGIFHALA